MSNLKLFLLGPPRVELDHSVVDIRRRKTLALLVYLAVANEDQRRDTLATLLWPDASQNRARASLSRDLSGLNKRLGGSWLTAERETVAFRDDAQLWVDCMQFQQRLAACQSHQHLPDQICSACLESLTEAVDLYRADFLSGFSLSDCPAFDEWQSFQTESFRRELATVLERLSQAHQAQGDSAAAISYARRWLSLDPLHEPAHRQLMQLYAQTGDRAAAVRQYQGCLEVLEAELGVSPAEETTALYERIRTEMAGPVESIPSVPRHNLPAQSIPFVGREGMLVEIKDRLQDPECRLLTLVGPGGSGKTRLALEAGAAQVDNFEHGVFLVSLAPLDSVEAIVPTVAETLGFSFYATAGGSGVVEPQQQLLDYLRQKTMLLIMDSYEHLLSPALPPALGEDEGGASLVIEILKTAPQVKILATSRVRLNVGGEHRFQVGGMDYPTLAAQTTFTSGALAETALYRAQDVAQYDAVKLFLQGARRAQPGFTLTAENLSGVVRICHLVEGMPLAIRLAAAWVEILSPAEIAEEIERGLDFLETEVRDVPARQRNIRAAFSHSWQLLTAREKTVYQALSIFRGGFTRQAAAEVAGASVRELKALVDKSFLTCVAEGRYEIHELLRQYAADKLEQVPAITKVARDRHSAYYCGFLQQREADLKGARQQAAMAEIETELKNARLAWNWAVTQGQIERLGQAIDSLGTFYEWRGRYQEGESAFWLAGEQLAPPESGDEYRLLARVLAWLGHFNQLLDRSERTVQLLEQSLALLDDPGLSGQDIRPEKAFVLRVMGETESSLEKARQLYEQSLDLYRALGDRWGTAVVLASLSYIAWALKGYEHAKQLGEESLAIRRTLGDHRGIAESLTHLGRFATDRGQLEESERLTREGLALFRELGDRPAVAWRLFILNVTLCHAGKFAEARPILEEMLQIYSNLGHRGGVARAHQALGYVEMMLGRYQQARTLIEKAGSVFQEIGWPVLIGWNFGDRGKIALAEQAYIEARQLLQEAVANFREAGFQSSLDEMLDDLAYAERGLGHTFEAQQYLSEALQIATEVGAAFLLWDTLPAVALLLVDRGEPERAVEIYALASRYPYVANSRWFEDVAGQYIAASAATLPPEVVTAAQERGRARDVWETARELLVEFDG